MATGGLYGQSPTGALIAQPGTETTGLYGKSPNGSVIAQPGSESSGLYGGSPNFGGSYFEWFVFQVSASQPATPTGGSWSFTNNVGTPPSGWSNAPANAPTNPVWISIGLVNSRSNTPIVWSTPGVFSYSGQLNGSGVPTSGIGIDGTFYIQTGVSPYAIWFKNSGTWVQVTGAALYVALTGDQTIGGTKTFSSLIQGSISGNAATATSATTAATATYATTAGSATTAGTATYATSAGSVPYSGLTGTVPTWNQNTTGNAATANYATNAGNATTANSATLAGNVTGVIAIANGGTGASDATTARTNLGLGTAAVRDAGVALGVATLDAGGTVPLSQIPASIQGGVSYQGTWNATTNSPTLTSSVGTKGYYYVVSVAGSTNLNGITTWNIGDWAIFNGTAWEKIDNTDAVTSVNGQTGTVVLTAADIGGLGTMAVQNANAVAITGGNESGVTHSGDIIGTHLDYTPGAAPSYAEGRTWYDSTAKALAYYNDVSGVQIHIGHDLQFKVINNTGSTIPNGSPVYITGTSSGQTYPNVALAKADVAATATVIGLTDGAIANGAAGYVTSIGNIDNVNTGTFTVGQVLYLSPYSAGQLMNTIPPTGITVQVGMVTFVNSSTGKIYVKQTTPLNVPASIISGTVAVANGGTGASTAAGARTNLGLGTIATQDANSVAITGGTIDNTVIGGTTPAAGTFTTLTATGQTSLGGAADAEALRAVTTASAINWIQVSGATNGNAPSVLATGANTNVFLDLASKGSSGGVRFKTAVSTEQMRVSHTASAVNYVQVTGAATTVAPQISAQGSDTNVGFSVSSKGTGQLGFYTNSVNANSRHLDITHTGSVVNRFTLTGSQTGFGVTLGLNGTDTNISQVFQSKGTGAIDLAAGSSGVNISNGGTVTAITRTNLGNTFYTSQPSCVISAPTTAGGVQATGVAAMYTDTGTTVSAGGTGYTVGDILTLVGGTPTSVAATFTIATVSAGVVLTVTPINFAAYSVLPSSPAATTGGAGTGCTLNVLWKLNNVTITNAGSGYVEQPTVTFSGGGGSGAAAYASVGAATTIKTLFGTSTSGLDLATPAGAQVRIADIGDGTRPLQLNGGSAGAAQVAGIYNATSGAALALSTNAGTISFYSGGRTATEQARISHTASAVNYVQVTGSATTLFPNISAQGSDTNIGLTFASKGSQSLRFNTNSTDQQFRITHTGSAVNYVQVTGNIAGSSPRVLAEGSDTNIDLSLVPKGTGGINAGNNFANFLDLSGAASGFGAFVASQGSDTNIPLVLQPKGTGALQAQQTDSTATGGNARGANAVDWQTLRNSSSEVASGAYSVVGGGQRNTASGAYAQSLGGYSNSSSGFESVLIGGQSNAATGQISFIGGGTSNITSGYGSTVVGGTSNTSAGVYSFIGAGQSNSGTSGTIVTTQSATMNGTTAVTLSGSNANIKVGQYISGTSIATDTYVAAISGTSLTLSKVASGSSTSTLSFFTPHGVVVGGGNNQATGSYSFIGGGGDAGTAGNRNVASGDWSFVGGGRGNTASAIGSFVGGGGLQTGFSGGNTASGEASTISGGFGNIASNIGATVVGGYQNTASGGYSSVIGRYGATRGISGFIAFAASNTPINNTQGMVQAGLLVLCRQTTDATATVLCSDSGAAGTSNQVILPNNSAYFFKGEVIAGVTGGGNTKGWTIEGVIKRGANAAATTLVGSTVTSMYGDVGAATWVIALSADTTNGGLAVTFTGQAATTIRTVCQISTTEMTY